MDTTERTRLRALRKRADGSWRLLTADDVDSDKDIAENGCTFVADLGATDVRHRRCWSIVGPLNIVAMPHEIGALIVGAVNALPALLDDSERLATVERERDEARAEVERLRRELAETRGDFVQMREDRDACKGALSRANELRIGDRAEARLDEREVCAAICENAAGAEASMGDAERAEGDDEHADARMTRASALRQVARAIRARGAGGGA